jgi:hypothetical protein
VCVVDLCYLTIPWCTMFWSCAVRGIFSFRHANSLFFSLRGNFLSARRSTVPVEFQSAPIDHSSMFFTS